MKPYYRTITRFFLKYPILALSIWGGITAFFRFEGWIIMFALWMLFWVFYFINSWEDLNYL